MADRSGLLKVLLLLTMSAGLFVLVFELGVLVLFGEQPKFPRHVVGTDFGVRVNQPDTTYRHKSADGTWWFTINSRGLRSDTEFSYEKPAGVFRVVSLGDSFTTGYEVDEDEIFSSVLGRRLREAGHRVEVLNAGVSGYSNAEALVYLERELLKYDPDLVILSFYGNDLVDNVRSGLFGIVDGRLVQTADRYVPAGRLGDFLNTNPIFNWLSGYSNAFVFAKERLTHLVKRQIVEQNRANVAAAAGSADETRDGGGHREGGDERRAGRAEARGRDSRSVLSDDPFSRNSPDHPEHSASDGAGDSRVDRGLSRRGLRPGSAGSLFPGDEGATLRTPGRSRALSPPLALALDGVQSRGLGREAEATRTHPESAREGRAG